MTNHAMSTHPAQQLQNPCLFEEFTAFFSGQQTSGGKLQSWHLGRQAAKAEHSTSLNSVNLGYLDMVGRFLIAY